MHRDDDLIFAPHMFVSVKAAAALVNHFRNVALSIVLLPCIYT
jgi:hypothetical protein